MAGTTGVQPTVATGRSRLAYADNLKVVLVVAVIVGHVTMAFSGMDAWVLSEPAVREPLRTLVQVASVVGVLFAMALFFLVAGRFTPDSLRRKGLARFTGDRALRLGVPMLFFIIVFAPIVEFADTDNAGWDDGFAAFVPVAWRDVAPGPTWFLGVLLLFSVGYALVRSAVPRRQTGPVPLRARDVIAASAFIAVASFLIRMTVPFGDEVWHLALGQAPAWLAGFVLGVLAAERGWLDPLPRPVGRRLGWLAAGCAVAVIGVFLIAAALGGEAGLEQFAGGGTGASMVLAAFEGPLVVAVSLWLFDLFHRRANVTTPLLAWSGEVAFPAFLVHQVVAVGAIVAIRSLMWPPEGSYLAAAILSVVGSFALGALLLRIPGVALVIGTRRR